MRLKLLLLVIASFMFWASVCFGQSGQNQCEVKPGDHIIPIPLQQAPDSFEPGCQPARIRVSDRKPVSFRLTGLSPIDVCTPSSKPQTITTVASPLETIINTVTGLKAFTFGNGNDFLARVNIVGNVFTPANETAEEKKKREDAEARDAATKADQEALKLFIELSKQIPSMVQTVYDKQTYWLQLYQNDIKSIAHYLAADYRGSNYTKFVPETDGSSDISAVRNHIGFPASNYPPTPADIPSELDYAGLQALVDQMKSLQTRLITSCTTSGKMCDKKALQTTAELVDEASAFLQVAQDNLKTLQADQAAVVTSYTALDKVFLDFKTRVALKVVKVNEKGVLQQDINMPPDYGATDMGAITCVSDALSTQATTDAINYSILFQRIPALTMSAGLLTTLLQERQLGTQPEQVNGVTSTYFAVTNSGAAQVLPMAFVNYKLGKPYLTTWPGQPESELVITHNISGGIGINPNTGTNQVEFFGGYAVSLSRVYIHIGAHLGRTQSLGGGFQLNTVTPAGFMGTPPINWSYHPAFAFGLSVRLAPF